MEGQFSEKYKTKKSEGLITLRLSYKINVKVKKVAYSVEKTNALKTKSNGYFA